MRLLNSHFRAAEVEARGALLGDTGVSRNLQVLETLPGATSGPWYLRKKGGCQGSVQAQDLGREVLAPVIYRIFYINLMLYVFYIPRLWDFWFTVESNYFLFIIIIIVFLFCFHEISEWPMKTFEVNELDSSKWAQAVIWYMKLQEKEVLQEVIINISKYCWELKWDVGGKVTLDRETRMSLVTLDTVG